MSEEVLIVFTAKSADSIIRDGGTSWWRLDRNHARRCGYVVCTRNGHTDSSEGQEEHHSAFLIGKVKDVVTTPEHKSRYLIQFSEYAIVNVPQVWQGDRNPVKYSTLDTIGIDPLSLKWERMPEPHETSQRMQGTDASPLSLNEAKARLALTFGVSSSAIEIVIRA
jgi:hypothetical protein